MSQRQGVRESKRRAAMLRVQEVAMDLFDEHGFAGVTVEQIAAAAKVSPSSVYRYFGTKEGLVLVDTSGGDERIEPAVRGAQGGDVIDVARRRLLDYLTSISDDDLTRRRVGYLMEVPSVQAAVSRQLFDRLRAVGAEFASDRRGDGIDFDVQVALGASYGAVLGALQYWYESGYDRPLSELLDETITALRTGFGER